MVPGVVQPVGTVVLIAFLVSLVAYFKSGGYQMVVEPEEWREGRPVSIAAVIGRIGVSSLALGMVFNVVEAFFEDRPVPAWLDGVAWLVSVVFVSSFVGYVTVRIFERRADSRP